MKYENGFKSLNDGSLPEDIDWSKTEIYAPVPEEAPRSFWDKLWSRPSNWEELPQVYIKSFPGAWARIYDPANFLPTYVNEHTQDGEVVSREILVTWYDKKVIKQRKIRVDWKSCLYRVLEGENAPIKTKTKAVSELIHKQENK